ncbi:hypothetical protein [Microbacterium sp. Be9]|uniref:hypothetical protein n=1 Tax=Microbacterium sp. Be9 TaxID=2720211 RepID=UPI001423C9F6|nr:hypothetical protein [Microbacterium sp. Be9]NIG66445.1 hypothetical protein [Microbacterium sp. Be9]
MPDYYLNDSGISAAGHLVQYSTFRYNTGIANPMFQLSDWHHNWGAADQYMRFGLRNGSGAQVSNSIQFDPGQGYTWKYFTKVGGGTISGNVALNARSADYGGSWAPGTVAWNGILRLN